VVAIGSVPFDEDLEVARRGRLRGVDRALRGGEKPSHLFAVLPLHARDLRVPLRERRCAADGAERVRHREARHEQHPLRQRVPAGVVDRRTTSHDVLALAARRGGGGERGHNVLGSIRTIFRPTFCAYATQLPVPPLEPSHTARSRSQAFTIAMLRCWKAALL